MCKFGHMDLASWPRNNQIQHRTEPLSFLDIPGHLLQSLFLGNPDCGCRSETPFATLRIGQKRIKYIRNNAFLVFVIIVWLIVQLFEANGRRAHASEAMMLSFGESMKTTIAIFLSVRYNKWFLLLTVSAILAAVIHHSIKEKRNPFRVGKLSAMIVLALLLTRMIEESFLYLER